MKKAITDKTILVSVMAAMLNMTKLDIETLERAAERG